jgi:GNAT superfamily N-acetyltransferase
MNKHEQWPIESLEKPAWGEIGGALTDYNHRQAGDDHARNLCFVLRDEAGEIAAGVIGTTYWNWLSIELMWVREDLRGQGIGARLLSLAEDEARSRGTQFVHLDTFSFQARGFYEKFGYAVFGELADFPPGHQRYYMKKTL